jgi:hypothetical protein
VNTDHSAGGKMTRFIGIYSRIYVFARPLHTPYNAPMLKVTSAIPRSHSLLEIDNWRWLIYRDMHVLVAAAG